MSPRANDKRRTRIFMFGAYRRARARFIVEEMSRGAFQHAMEAPPYGAMLGAMKGALTAWAWTQGYAKRSRLGRSLLTSSGGGRGRTRYLGPRTYLRTA